MLLEKQGRWVVEFRVELVEVVVAILFLNPVEEDQEFLNNGEVSTSNDVSEYVPARIDDILSDISLRYDKLNNIILHQLVVYCPLRRPLVLLNVGRGSGVGEQGVVCDAFELNPAEHVEVVVRKSGVIEVEDGTVGLGEIR